MVVFGADEVSAIVLEFGTHSTRMGYSGDDQPRVILPSSVGSVASPAKDAAHSSDAAISDGAAAASDTAKAASKTSFLGDLALAYPHEHMQVRPALANSAVVDWQALESIWAYALEDRLRLAGNAAADFPLMLVDSAFAEKSARERMVQLAFERFNAPAVFLGKAPVLASYAAGKHTALVVDIGAGSMKVVPVCDGYVVKAGSLQQSLGGNFLSDQIQTMFERDLMIDGPHIPQEIAKKYPAQLGVPAKFDPKPLPNATPSFFQYHRKRIIDDFKESVCQVSEGIFNEIDLALRPPKYYEFPDGYNRNFGLERYRIGEILFNPQKYAYTTSSGDGSDATSTMVGLAELIIKSVQQCDVDLRGALVNNVVLTGGGSLLHGLTERLNFELNRVSTFGRVRVQASSGSLERKFGPWVGGSILSSLGTFQQMWLTRQEYHEHGVAYIERKCP